MLSSGLAICKPPPGASVGSKTGGRRGVVIRDLGSAILASREEIRSAANQLRKTYQLDKMAYMPRFWEEAERQARIINRAVAEALSEMRSRSTT